MDSIIIDNKQSQNFININKDNKEGNMLSRWKNKTIFKGAVVSIAACILMLIPVISHALPQGGNVAGGGASISTPDTSTMNITQTTNRAIINWQGFSIDVNELVKFIQPGSSAVALNRVVGVDPSSILGQLVANGNIFLVNPNGIVFGPNSTVDVAGLLATTLNISDTDFMSGNYSFFQDQDKALSYIINKGKIVINDNGFAVLVAPLVSNEGLIIANLGQVKIGAAEQFTVNFDGEGLINFVISNSSGQTPGTVLIPASQITDIIKEVVNTTQIIEAGQVVEEDGVVKLVGASGTAINTGTIQADGAAGKNAGSIEINSTQATVVGTGSLITANGVGENSSGGEIKILSDMGSGFAGIGDGATVEAKGGESGNGGLVEISANRLYAGGSVDTLAQNGEGGTFIIDPTDITIGDGATGVDITCAAGVCSSNGSAGSSTLWIGQLNGFIAANANVTVTTASPAVAPAGGDIIVNSVTAVAITDGGLNRNLTLRADEDISIISAINFTGIGTLTLSAGQSALINTGGITAAAAAVTANNLVAVADTSIIMTNLTVNSMNLTTNQAGVILATNTQGAAVTASAVNQAITITATTGNLAINTVNAGTAGVQLTATAGSITDSTPGADAPPANITGGNVLLTAATGIGAAGLAADIDLSATTVTANVTGIGDIYLQQSSGNPLTVPLATTFQGNINVDVTGANLSASLVTAGTGGGAGNVTLSTSTSGNVTVGDVTATGDTVTVTSAGSIFDNNDSGATNITANTINLTSGAAGNIGSTTLTVGPIPEGYLDLDITAGSGAAINLGMAAGTNLYLNFWNGINMNSSQVAFIPMNLANIGLGVTNGNFTFNDNTFGGAGNIWNLTVYANNIGFTLNTAAQYEVQTSGNVTLNALTGTITDTNDALQLIDIIANTLNLNAASGIGTALPISNANSLEIDATTLNAQVTGAGLISIQDLGANGLIVPLATTINGSIGIQATGNSAGTIDLTIGTITAGGVGNTVTLIANNTGAGTANILDDNDNGTTIITASNISLTAKTDIGSTFMGGGPPPDGYLDIDAAALTGTLTIGAGTDDLYLNFRNASINSSAFAGVLPGSLNNIGIAVSDGGFTFNDPTFGGAAGHGWTSLSVYAKDNINLSYTGAVDSIDIWLTGAGTVTLQAGTDGTGSIFDTTDATDTLDIRSGALTLIAANGIGIGGGAGTIEVMVPTLANAQVTGAGSIDLHDVAGGLAVTSATTSNGNITILADDNAVGAITLSVDSIIAGGAGNTVTLTAANAGAGGALINEVGAGDLGTDIQASNISLTAKTGIGTTASAPIEISGTAITATTGSGAIDLANNNAAATTANLTITAGTGAITFAQTGGGDLNVNPATTFNGNITISVDSANLTATTVTAGDSDATVTEDVTLTTTTSGDVYVANVTAPDNIQITSVGTIEETLPSDAGADLTSDRMSLTANDGIGTAGNSIELDTRLLTLAQVNNPGIINLNDIGVTNDGGLIVTAATTADGDITIAANDPSGFGISLAVNNITANGAGNTVTLTSLSPPTYADIVEQGADAAADITATNISLEADDGIGTAARIEIDATTLTLAQVNWPGIIDLRDVAGGLIVTQATTVNGNITIQAYDPTASPCNLVIGTVTAGGPNAVSLRADSTGGGNTSILDDGNDTTMISGNNVTLAARTAIGANTGGGAPPLDYVDIDAAPLAALTITSIGGTLDDLYLNFINAANVNSSAFGGLPAGLSNIGIGVTSGSFTFNDGTFDGGAAASWNLEVYANTNIDLNYDLGNDIQTTGNVVLFANTGHINDITATDNNVDIRANDLQMTATTGIEGAGANPISGLLPTGAQLIETTVSNLTATNIITSGNIYVENTQALQVDGLTNSAPGGGIRIYNVTAGLLTIAGNVTSQAGAIYLAGDNGLTINAGPGTDIVSNNAFIYLDSDFYQDGGVFTQNANSTIDAGTNRVELWLSGNSRLNDVRGNRVDIFFDDNAEIADNGSPAVTATTFVIDAWGLNNLTAGGIDLITQVTNMQIGQFAASAGNIIIANTGTLNLNDIGSLSIWPLGGTPAPWGYSVNNPGGQINISTSSPLNVNADVTGTGNITLTADGGDTGLMTVDADVISSGGDVYLYADNGINITLTSGTTNVISAGGGDIEMDADKDGSNNGAISQTNGTVGSGGEDLVLNAAEGIDLGSAPAVLDVATVQADNSTSNNISLINQNALSIVGTGVNNNASGGSVYVETLNSDLNVNADVTSNNGTINLVAWDNIIQATATSIDSAGGLIMLQADSNDGGVGDITQNGTADISSHGGNIFLTAGTASWGGNINLTLADAGSGNVTVTTYNGNITDNDLGTVPGDLDIIGNDVTLSAAAGIIGGPSPAEIDIQMTGLLTATSGNSIYLGFSGDVILGDITAPNIVDIMSTANILDDLSDATDISAGTIYLTAGADIGSAPAPGMFDAGFIDIDVTSLVGTGGQANSVWLTGALGSDIYLNFLYGDFDTIFFNDGAFPNGISPNNVVTSINSLTINVPLGNDIYYNNNIFNVNDAGAATGIFYNLYLLSSDDIFLNNPIVTNDMIVTLAAGGNLTLTMGSITFNNLNPFNTLVFWADYDADGDGRVTAGGPGPIPPMPILLTNVNNLILVAAEGIETFTQTTGPLNVAAYNSGGFLPISTGYIYIDNIGGINVFDGQAHLFTHFGIDMSAQFDANTLPINVNGIHNMSTTGFVGLVAHSDVDILAPITDPVKVGVMADGYIHSTGALLFDIQAPNAVLVAGTGIGTSLLPIITDSVANLAAYNALSGDIVITNTNIPGGLTITNVTFPIIGTVYNGVTNDGGSIQIIENSPIIINSPVFATGNVLLVANDNVGNDGYINVNATVSNSDATGFVALVAAFDININADITTPGIGILAADAPGVILTVNNNNYGVGAINQVSPLARVTATNLFLYGQAIGTSPNPINTDAGELIALAGSPVNGSVTGDIYINELNSIKLTLMVTVDGAIEVTSGGNMEVDTLIDSMGTNYIWLNSGGVINQTTAAIGIGIIADEFRFDAAGAVTLNNTNNDVNTIAGQTTSGDIQYTDTDDLIIGTVQGLPGLTTNGGNITVGAGENIDINQNVASNGGDIMISSEDDINQATATTINSSGGNIELQADNNDGGYGGIYQTGTASIVSGGGDITLRAGAATGGDNIGITLVDAGTGNVNIITHDDGAIVDNDAVENNDIVATNLTLEAVNGIGDADEIDTQVSNLQATNTNNGIWIVNTGALTLADINFLGYSVNNPNGWVTIFASSPLLVASGVYDLGPITLQATEDGGNDDDLTISADVQSTGGGLITLRAGHDIIQTAGTISTTNGIIMEADYDAGTGGIINQIGGNITCDTLTATAYGSITLNQIGNDFNSVTAHAYSAGDIILRDDDDVTLTDVDTVNGDITVVAGGALVATDVQAGGGDGDVNLSTTAAGDITLTLVTATDDIVVTTGAAAGDILLGSITATDDIWLTATQGAINEIGAGDAAVDIVGDVVTLTAQDEIGGAGELDIETTINTLDASSTLAGDIVITETNNIILSDIDTNNGDIIITSGGQMTATDVVAGGSGDIFLTTTAGDILVGTITALDDDVILTSAGAVTDNNVAVNNITALNLIINTFNGIGTLPDPLETTVSNLAARVTNVAGAGAIAITNTGDLVLRDPADMGYAAWGYAVQNSGTGPIIIVVNSNLTIDDPVNSFGGPVTMIANSGDIYQNATGDVTTTGGLYTGTAFGQYWMADGAFVTTGNGNIDIDAGGNITIGQLITNNFAYLNTTGGAILDGGDIGGEDIQAGSAELIASTGIGNGNAIETLLTNLAGSSATGPININETNALVITQVGATLGISTTGDISLNVGGALTQNNGNDITSNGGNITINATSLTQNDDSAINAQTGGNVNVSTTGNISLDSISGADVTLTSTTGGIAETGAGDAGIDITATNLTLSAATDIGAAANPIETDVDTLAILAAANAYLDENDSILLNNINVTNTFDLTTHNNGTVTSALGTKITAATIDINADGLIDINTNVTTATLTTSNDNITITEDNTLVINDVNAGTGDVTITLLLGTLTSNGATKITGNDLVINGAGAVDVNTNVDTLTASTNNDNITIDEDNNLGLNLVNAGTGDVTIRLAAGAITDNNGINGNIIGDDLTLLAVNGIGSGDSLETQVNRLQATNTNNGIEITNTGALTLADINTLGYAVQNTNGWVTIIALSPLTVDSHVYDGMDIVLVAGDNDAANNDNLAIAANVNVQSTGGDVLLQAGDDITQAAGTGVISAGGGDIDLIAGHDNDGDGLINIAGKVGSGAENLYMEADQTITALTNVATLTAQTNNADITVTEDNGLGLNNVDAGMGDVTLTLLAGALTSNPGTEITGNQVFLTAPAGINVNTNIDELTAATTNADIVVTEDNGLTINDINAGTGDVTFTLLAGALTSNGATKITGNDLVINGAGAIDVNTNVDTLAASTNNANIIIDEDSGLALNLVDAGTGDVSITLAAGAITDNNGASTNIIGNDLTLTAIDGIGSGDALETDVDNLQATNTNNGIEITNTGGLTLRDINSLGYAVSNTNGWVTIIALSPLTVDSHVYDGMDIVLIAGDNDVANNDDLTIATNVNIQSTGGDVLLQAGDDVVQVVGAGIVSAGGGDIQIIASHDNDGIGLIDMAGTVGSGNESLTLFADQGINLSNAQVAQLNAYNISSGDISITNTGDLTIDDFSDVNPDPLNDWGVENDNGAVTIINTGSIDIPGTNGAGVYATGDILLRALGVTSDITAGSDNSMTSAVSISGNVTLEAGRDIYLGQNHYSDVYTDSGPGSITLTAGNDITIDHDTYIESASGLINMTAGNNLSLISTGHISSTTGNISLTATSGNIVIGPNAGGVISTSGDILLSAGNNIDLGVLQTSGDVTLTLLTGAVTDNNGATLNVTGDDLVITAPGGVDLDTSVNTLAADTTGNNGDVTIREADGLGLNNVNAGTGDVTLTLTAGALTSNPGAKITGNQVFLTAPAGINVNTNIDELTADTTNADIVVTEDSGLTINDINAGTGDVTFTLLAGALISNGATKITGNDLVINGAGAIDVNTNVDTLAASTNNANIIIDEDNALALNLVDAGTGNVTISLSGGAITDNNGSSNNVNATDLILSAVTGIGSGDSLEMTVDRLAVRVTTGNENLRVTNTGDLTLANLAGWGYSISNAGTGYIDIEVNSNILIGSPVIGDNTRLAANSGAIFDANETGNDIQELTAGAGNLQLVAVTGIGSMGDGATSAAIETDVTNLSASSTTGPININELSALNIATVVVEANTLSGVSTTGRIDLNVGGALTQNNGNNITSNGGNITINATSLTQNDDSAINAQTGGNVNLTTTGNISLDSISGADVTLTSTAGGISETGAGDAGIDITATNLILSASTGIGSGNALETDVDNLQATNTNNGVEIANTGGMTIMGTGVSNTNGWVALSTSGALTVNSSVNAGGYVALTATGGANGDVTINANITANGVSGTTGNGVRILSDDDVIQNANITSNNTIGAVYVEAGIGTTDGIITMANGTSTTSQNDNGAVNSIEYKADGDISISLLSSTGTVKVTTATGAIIDNNLGSNNISGNTAILTAANGIGYGGDTANALETTISNLSASNSTSGDIRIDNGGDLNIIAPGVTNSASGGVIFIDVASNLNVNANVTSNNGVIALTATDSIIQSTGTLIGSTGGAITLWADTDDDGVGGITQNGTASIVSGGGNILLNAGVATGGGNILLTRLDAGTGAVYVITYNGSIIDNDSGIDSVDILADADSGLYAGGGIIGWEYNPVTGIWTRDPIDVDTGRLYVYASDVAGPYPVSVDIRGVAEIDVSDDWGTPPGLILYNDSIVGGGNIEDLYRAATPDLDTKNYEFSQYLQWLLETIVDDELSEALDQDDGAKMKKKKWWRYITR